MEPITPKQKQDAANKKLGFKLVWIVVGALLFESL